MSDIEKVGKIKEIAHKDKYDDDVVERCLFLMHSGEKTSKVSAVTGVPQNLLTRWRAGIDVDEGRIIRVSERLKAGVLHKLNFAQSLLLDRGLDEERIERSSTKDLITSMAIVTDKIQLLTGQATANVYADVNLNVRATTDLKKMQSAREESEAMIIDLKSRMAKRVDSDVLDDPVASSESSD